MSRYEEVKHYIEVESDSGCKLLTKQYKNNNTKMLFECRCGREFETLYRSFRYANIRSCKVCSGNRYDLKYIKEHIAKNSNCKLLTEKEVIGTDRIILLCECGVVFESKFVSFLHENKKQCNGCGIDKRIRTTKKTNEMFDLEIYNLVEGNYSRVGDYTGTDYNLLMRHNECGHKFYMRPSDFLTGQRCPLCKYDRMKLKITKSHEMFTDEIKTLYGNRYTVLGKYKTARIHIEIKCNDCGYIWDITPDSILRGHGCPKCASSKGEKAISSFLDNNNIKYETEKTFATCRNVKPLPFDFYLSKHNILIEYDGEHHFQPVNFGGCTDEVAEEGHKATVRNDIIKDQYAKDNNIKLIRIPYWEFDNISEMLSNLLN